MASGNIKGIVIEIGGDVSGLESALKDVNKQSKDLQSELKEVERSLKLNPGNVELVRQRQELLTQSIQQTSQKLDTLRQAQAQVQAQFDRGEIGADQYRAFQRELTNTESQLSRFQSQLNGIQGEQDRLAQNTRDLNTFFQATGTTVDDFSARLGTGLTNAIREGRASADQLERALNQIGRASLGAGQDLDQFRNALRNADNGANIDEIRRDLDLLGDAAQEAEQDVEGLGDTLKSVVGGAVAGGGIAGTVQQALNTSSLNTKIDVVFDVPEESKATIQSAIRDIEAYGVDAESALEGVRRQWALNKDASDEANQKIVEGAGAITAAYSGLDFIELVQEVNEIGAALEITNEDALALTNSLLKAGFPTEQIDIIAEYGTQMKEAGFNAAEIQAIFERGIETKTWNIDNLNDGVKEIRLQMGTFGSEVPKALKPLIEQTGLSVKQFQDWGKAVAGGGTEGSKAMAEMVTWLDGIEDATLKNDLATAAFGTKWEDQGKNMTAVFQGISDAQDQTVQNQEEFNQLMNGVNADPMIQLKQATSDVLVALQPLLTKVAEFVSQIAGWIQNNSGLAATITAIVTAVGILTGAVVALAPAIFSIQGIMAAAGISFSAIAGPIAIAVAAIAGLVTAGVFLYKNWDQITAFLSQTWDAIKSTASTVFSSIGNTLSSTWEAISSTIQTVWGNIGSFFTTVWESIKGVFTTVLESIETMIDGYWTSMEDGVTTVWDGINQYFSSVWDLIKNVFVGALLVITQLLTGQWKEAMSSTKQIWDNIKESLSGIWEGIKKVFSGALSAVVSFVKNHWENIKNTTSTIFNTVKSTISTVWNAIKTTISTVAESIWTTIKSKFASIVTSVSEKMTEVKTTITKLWNESVAFLKGIDLIQIGKDIVNGLIKGMGEKFGSLKKKVEELARLIPEWAKDILGINSPARVYAQVKIKAGFKATKQIVKNPNLPLIKIDLGGLA